MHSREKALKHFLGIDIVISKCLWDMVQIPETGRDLIFESPYKRRLTPRKHSAMERGILFFSETFDWAKK